MACSTPRRRSAPCSMSSPACGITRISMPPAGCSAPMPSAISKPPRRCAALSRSARRRSTTPSRLAERLEFRLENLGYEFPALSACPTGETMDVVSARSVYDGRRARPLRHVCAATSARSSNSELDAHREARVLRLFSDRLGHRRISAASTTSWCRAAAARRTARSVIASASPRSIPVEQQSALRALSERRPQELAGHRSRSAERRPARARHPGSLPPLRQTRRGHDRERHHLSRTQRGARDRQGAELSAGCARIAFRIFSRNGDFPHTLDLAGADRAGRLADGTSARCRPSSRSIRRSTDCRAISASIPAG